MSQPEKMEEMASAENPSSALPPSDQPCPLLDSRVSSSVTDSDLDAILRVASAASVHRRRTEERGGVLHAIPEDDAALDPSKKEFDHYKWAKSRLNQLDGEGVLQKHAGVVFKDLNVSGSGVAVQLQGEVGLSFLAPFLPSSYRKLLYPEPRRQILHNFDGVIRSGEMLMVLGRPGSGCSTFQKTICGELHGLDVHPESVLNYNGIPMKKMHKEFKGECVYNQEVDKHFPHLTVGQTLEFAASARTPSHRLSGMSREEYVKETTQVAMAVLGLSHTYNTRGKFSLRTTATLIDAESNWQSAMTISEVFLVEKESVLGKESFIPVLYSGG